LASFTVTSVTGANGATQSMNYDAFNRPNSATSVDGAVTGYTYTYLPNMQTATISTTTNGTTTTQWKTPTFDGFGRPVRVQTGNNSTAVTNVDTQYGACGCSPLGKMTKTSLPYAAGGTPSWTTYTYDTSGRTLTETKPDGSVTTTSYAGNWVTVTDPAGKWKTYVSDATGGLTAVVEPNPSTTNINPVTYYWLNGAGQIVQVSVQRSGAAQNRNFAWSGADLISATDPETGTTTCQYDGNHHVTLRTDAKWQQTKYSYDTSERLVEVQHFAAGSCQTCQGTEQVNQRVCYTYDVNPLDPAITPIRGAG
jgi:YD repeat-containing protein